MQVVEVERVLVVEKDDWMAVVAVKAIEELFGNRNQKNKIKRKWQRWQTEMWQ